MINALQHIGLGVTNAEQTCAFYKRHFGFRFKLNDIVARCTEMTPVVGTEETMRIMMVANGRGGGVMEFVEHRSSPIRPKPNSVPYGHLGIVEIGCKVKGIRRYVDKLKVENVPILTDICELQINATRHWRYVYIKDPDGQILQLTEESRSDDPWVVKIASHGVFHIGIRVSDLDRSTDFYRDVLGFDHLLFRSCGEMPEIHPLTGTHQTIRFAILERSSPPCGPFSKHLPRGIVKLIEFPNVLSSHLYEGRRWGDIGCMEFALDVSDLNSVLTSIRNKGVDIYLNPVDIDMGRGSKGRIAYIRDPDGTIIELVDVTSLVWLSPHRFMKIANPLAAIYTRLC